MREVSDDRNDVKHPDFVGARIEVSPTKRLVLGASMTSIMGGRGRHLSLLDYGRFLIGKNADSASKISGTVLLVTILNGHYHPWKSTVWYMVKTKLQVLALFQARLKLLGLQVCTCQNLVIRRLEPSFRRR